MYLALCIRNLIDKNNPHVYEYPLSRSCDRYFVYSNGFQLFIKYLNFQVYNRPITRLSEEYLLLRFNGKYRCIKVYIFTHFLRNRLVSQKYK